MAVNSVANEGSEESETCVRGFTLEILQIIKDAQQQHGLRHGDYQRYRSYCTRRLRRLRKALHFVQGTKHRYQPKKISEETLKDVRFLYLPLVMTERAWGYAMQLKQESNTEPRKRFHLVSRMHKAVKYAQDLETLCQSSRCDARTKLEAQAYTAWIKGSLHFETEEWQSAIECFRRAQTIYEKLAGALNEDERVLYQQRVEEMTPNIRYCAYNIGDESAIDDLVKIRLAGGREDALTANLDHLISQTREKQAETLSEVSWLGRSVPVRQEKVRLFLLSAQECTGEVEKAPDLEAKVSVYERLLLECKDALQMLKDELKSDQTYRSTRGGGGQADSPVSSLNYLHSYLLYIRLSKTIERNLLLIQSLKSNLENKPGEGESKKPSKPQDLIRPHDIILQNLLEMTQLPGVDPNSGFVEEAQAQIIAYKAHRCYYLGQAYSVAGKWMEALALYQRATEYISQARKSGNLKKKDLNSLQALEAQVEGQKYSSHALGMLGAEQSDGQSGHNALQTKYLSERLDEYYSDPSLTSKQPRITSFPPDLQAIPCKPLFFDLALNHLEFPSLEDKVEQKKGGGLTGFVKGWLGGWKK